MTETFDENKPLYGSRGVDIYLKLVKHKYNYINIEELLSYAGMQAYQVKDDGHFFSQKQINRFQEKLVELTGNKNIAREAGRFASSPDAFKNVARFAIGFVSPVRFYTLMGKYVNKISKSSEYKANILASNKVEIVVTPNPGTREEPFQCENRMGYWEALTTLFKLKPPTIEHPECLFKGGKECRYLVTWPDSPVSNLKIFLNISLVILGLLCITFPFIYHFVHPSQTTLMLFIFLYATAITLILFFNWFLKKLETDNLVTTIELLRNSSDELIEQIDINYENSLLINEVAQILAKQSDVQGLFSEVISVLHKRLDYDRILVMLANADNTRLNYEAGFGYNPDQEKILHKLSFHLNNPDSKGIFYVSFNERKPILLNDINDIKNDLSERSYKFALTMEVKSLICCPITYENESLGILAVDNRVSKRPLIQRDINLLMGIALQIGSRLHNVKLESYLRQVQKMEAVGNLAGGVAHDFNNILTTILGYSQMMTLEVASNDPLWKMADDIHQAGLKAASLTQQLLAFSRKQVLEMQVTNLNVIVVDMNKMLTRLIGEDVNIKSFLAPNTENIMADPSQIGQILMNLVVNARDAMPDGGEIIIETGDIVIDEKYAQTRKGMRPGHYTLLSVTDTGMGMNHELREKIFEPFFTTKSSGKGTGLGLSTVYGIVKQHKGFIYVYSEPEHGTTFQLYFPIVKKELDQKKPNDNQVLPVGDGETILIVDDDESIRRLIMDTLEPLGYDVLSAASGFEALEKCEQVEKKIDLVLSDVIIPGMNGRQLVETMQHQCPHVKAILMSGYPDNVIAQHGVVESNYILINKPILPISLANRIREILDKNDGKPYAEHENQNEKQLEN